MPRYITFQNLAAHAETKYYPCHAPRGSGVNTRGNQPQVDNAISCIKNLYVKGLMMTGPLQPGHPDYSQTSTMPSKIAVCLLEGATSILSNVSPSKMSKPDRNPSTRHSPGTRRQKPTPKPSLSRVYRHARSSKCHTGGDPLLRKQPQPLHLLFLLLFSLLLLLHSIEAEHPRNQQLARPRHRQRSSRTNTLVDERPDQRPQHQRSQERNPSIP